MAVKKEFKQAAAECVNGAKSRVKEADRRAFSEGFWRELTEDVVALQQTAYEMGKAEAQAKKK